ncbi:MAG: hypothetical protein WDZ31_00185 [Phycisphaeraceae bacterium]
MNSFILAQYYGADLNPLDWPPLFAVMVIGMLLALVRQQWAPRLQTCMLFVAPPLLLVLLVLLGAMIPFTGGYFSSFVYSVFLALILYMAFGFGFALANLRRLHPAHRILGSIFTYIFGCIIVWVWITFVLPADLTDWVSLAVVVTAAVAWMPLQFWFDHQATRQYRHQQGLCVQCEYDLRGSTGQSTCPECGTALRPTGSQYVRNRRLTPEAVLMSTMVGLVLLELGVVAYWLMTPPWDYDVPEPHRVIALGVLALPLACAGIAVIARRVRGSRTMR